MYLVIKNLPARYSGTLRMKIHLIKITKCLAHYICSYTCISNIFLKARCARILKVKPKTLFTLSNFDRSINIMGIMVQI